MCLGNANTEEKPPMAGERSCVMGRSEEEEAGTPGWDQGAVFPSCLGVSCWQV